MLAYRLWVQPWLANTFVTLTPSADPRVVKTRELITVAGETRHYVISRSAACEPGATVPLIFAFHGYRGEVKAWMHEYTRFEAFIPEQKFIIVYPEAPVSWADRLGSRDVAFFDALLASLAQQFPVDRRRVYVIGHSNGAGFASFLLLARPGVVAAGAVHSGLTFPDAVEPTPSGRKPPLLVIWGEQDEINPAATPEVQACIGQWRRAGFPGETIILPHWGHSWGGSANQIEEKILSFLFRNPLSDTATLTP